MTELWQRSSREIYRNRWLGLREDEVEYPDGSTALYTVLERPDFATIVPWDGGGFWLVQQYRYPVGGREWEFPQGSWPVGCSGTAADLAVLELAEETGLSARSWTHLGRLWTGYALSTQAFDVFLATELTAGQPSRELTEQDMVHKWFAEAEVRAMIRDGRLRDVHTIAALTLYDLGQSTPPAHPGFAPLGPAPAPP
ncbi:MAG: NUDIX domain-containing protein [Jatrophihabitantaceae bacterium]